MFRLGRRRAELPAELFVGKEFYSRVWNDANTVGPIAFHHPPEPLLFGHMFQTLQQSFIQIYTFSKFCKPHGAHGRHLASLTIMAESLSVSVMLLFDQNLNLMYTM